jgi:heavy metal sensor kinase
VKLATRISVFFLAALAVVVGGLSGSIYWLVRSHVHQQLDELSSAALDTLSAAVEYDPAGLVWELNVRRLSFGQTIGGRPIVWGVFTANGGRIDGSKDVSVPLFQSFSTLHPGEDRQTELISRGEPWRVAGKMLRADSISETPAADGSPDGGDERMQHHPRLCLAVGIPLEPFFKPLRTLATALVGISLVIWLTAALLGRRLCNRALAPVTQMAQTAGTISAADLNQRLPAVGTGDELEDLCRAFNGLLDRLQTSFERQQRFAAEASHQLRTPLAALMGQVDVALRRTRSADEYRRALDAAHEQAKHLGRIVEMLLFLTREEAEASPPTFQRIQLHDWLSDHLHSWQQHARFEDLRTDGETADNLWINVHSELLGQAVDNLLDNACKYSDLGSEIVVRASRRGDEVQLEIADHGIGIAPSDLAQLVHPFFRSAAARKRGVAGSGLGLSIVERIMTIFRGRLEVDSTPGKGSRFILVFPASSIVPADEAPSLTSSEV